MSQAVTQDVHLFSQSGTYYPPASEASRDVANLTERRNPQTPYMVSKNLPVGLLPNLTPDISGLANRMG